MGSTSLSSSPVVSQITVQRNRGAGEPRRHPFGYDTISAQINHAQRRPGHQPRRHRFRLVKGADRCVRSTKAGASAPATLRIYGPSRSSYATLNEGRGISPGDTSLLRPAYVAINPLNEGRGISPGDTADSPRARGPTGSLNEGRGISPGDTRYHRRNCRNYGSRSTKAGASAPATPQPFRQGQKIRRALNEGRGISPGDTGFGRCTVQGF